MVITSIICVTIVISIALVIAGDVVNKLIKCKYKFDKYVLKRR